MSTHIPTNNPLCQELQNGSTFKDEIERCEHGIVASVACDDCTAESWPTTDKDLEDERRAFADKESK